MTGVDEQQTARDGQAARAGDDAYRGVLELRVHGVNNTSPAAMLDLPEEAVERRIGDELAGFWRERPGAQARLRRDDRGFRPEPLTREAYSWGGLARTTPDVPGGGRFAVVGRAASRVGWTLVLPFGVANVAYWTRRLDTGPPPEGKDGGPDRPAGAGAGGARLFGLGLTMLAVVTACEVAMDLVATQCYVGGQRRCDRLGGTGDLLANHDLPVRLVIAAIAPLALLGLLFWLSTVTRSRYERAVHHARRDDTTQAHGPLLAMEGFWASEATLARMARLHFAVGLSVVTTVLAWPGVFGSGDACRRPRQIKTGECWDQVFGTDAPVRAGLLAGLVGAAAILGLAAVIACRTAEEAPDFLIRRTGAAGHKDAGADWAGALLGFAVGVLLAVVGLLLVGKPRIAEGEPLLGVNAAPTVTLAILCALVIGALGWRHARVGPRLLATAVLGAFGLAGFNLAAGALVLAVLVVVAIRAYGVPRAGDAERAHHAWAGGAPSTFMGLALVLGVTLSSLVTLVTGNWLNGPDPAAALLSGSGGEGPDLTVPTPYVLFGVGALVGVAAAGVALVVMAVRSAHAVIADPPLPAAPAEPAPAPPVELTDRIRRRVAGARRHAAQAHRAEPVLSLLASAGMFAVLVAVVVSAGAWPGSDGLRETGWEGGLRRVVEAGTWGLAAGGLALLGVLVAGGSGRTRPLGLVWDLVGFLPRAAHPFAPPCYAERAVPEIVERVAWWLAPPAPDAPAGPEPADDRRRGERVVLSAHSLGSVLAVAAVLALPRSTVTRPGRPVRLLTYGTQLRPYFGRIFPELLGPAVLGTREVGPPRLFTKGDPWKDADPPGGGAVEVREGSLLALVGGPAAWRSLWRRTDYLGFPVWSYDANAWDRPAEELDRTGYLLEVVTHGNYPRAEEYRRALDDLAGRRATSLPTPAGSREQTSTSGG